LRRAMKLSTTFLIACALIVGALLGIVIGNSDRIGESPVLDGKLADDFVPTTGGDGSSSVRPSEPPPPMMPSEMRRAVGLEGRIAVLEHKNRELREALASEVVKREKLEAELGAIRKQFPDAVFLTSPLAASFAEADRELLAQLIRRLGDIPSEEELRPLLAAAREFNSALKALRTARREGSSLSIEEFAEAKSGLAAKRDSRYTEILGGERAARLTADRAAELLSLLNSR